MRLFLKVFILLLFIPIVFGQQDLILHKPCYNETVSAYSSIKFGDEMLLTVHDLPSPNSTPDKNTRSKVVFLRNSCEVEDAELFHNEQKRMITLNIPSNSGPVSTNENEDLLFISNTDEGWNGNFGIYVLEKKGEGWAIQQEFPFNSSKYSIMHPAYDESRQRLYFSSDKDGGFFNLYYILFDGKSFGDEMIPLDFANSSKGNDVFPSVYKNNLYYSSDREGNNKLDLYEGVIHKKSSRKINEHPFESDFDDFAYVMVSERTGYFTTNRYSNGKKDERYTFRKPLDCSLLNAYIDEYDPLEISTQIVEKYKEIYGNDNMLTYELNFDFLSKSLDESQLRMDVFYCNLFKKLDSISLRASDFSLNQSIKTEHLLDSAFKVVIEDIDKGIVVDSLLEISEEVYKEAGIDLEDESKRRELKDKLVNLLEFSDSVVSLSDTIQTFVESKITTIERKKDFRSADYYEFIDDDGLEAPKGIYVIAGVYSKKDNLDKQLTVVKTEFPDAFHLQNSFNGYYYVVIKRTDSEEIAFQTKDKFNNFSKETGVWMLKYYK